MCPHSSNDYFQTLLLTVYVLYNAKLPRRLVDSYVQDDETVWYICLNFSSDDGLSNGLPNLPPTTEIAYTHYL